MNSRRVHNYIKKTIWIALHFILILGLTRAFVIAPGKVNGPSMEPGFYDEDFFLVNKTSYFFTPPKRFDLIQSMHPKRPEVSIIKRVIGLPGETVIIQSNRVIIRQPSGEEEILKEDYLPPQAITRLEPGVPQQVTLEDYEYFLLGDNRLFSGDSRHYGPVHRKYINGKVIRYSW